MALVVMCRDVNHDRGPLTTNDMPPDPSPAPAAQGVKLQTSRFDWLIFLGRIENVTSYHSINELLRVALHHCEGMVPR